VPKYVRLKNASVARLSRVTNFVVFGGLITGIVLLEMFYLKQDYVNSVSVATSHFFAGAAESSTDVCMQISRFNVVDMNQIFPGNQTFNCAWPCQNDPTPPCADWDHCIRKQQTGNFWIITRMTEWSSSATGVATSKQVPNYIIPTAGTVGIYVDYEFKIPAHFVKRKFVSNLKRLSASSADVTTILMGPGNQVIRSIPPKERIKVSLSELFQMTGNSLSVLDASQPSLTTATWSAPPIRLTGTEIDIFLVCKPLAMDKFWHENPHCEIRAKVKQKWTFFDESRSDVASGTVHRFRYYGIEIRFFTSCSIDVADPELVFYLLIAVIVCMGIPSRMISFFVVNCLGQLSEVYRNAIYQAYSLREEAAAMAMKMIVNQMVFMEIIDTPQGISKYRMSTRVRASLAKRLGELNPPDVERFLDFCFRSLVKSDQKAHSIDIERFQVACSNIQSFMDVILLFSHQRKPSLLEALFTPGVIAQAAWTETEVAEENPRPRRASLEQEQNSINDAENSEDIEPKAAEDVLEHLGFARSSESIERKMFRRQGGVSSKGRRIVEKNGLMNAGGVDSNALVDMLDQTFSEIEKEIASSLVAVKAEISFDLKQLMLKMASMEARIDQLSRANPRLFATTANSTPPEPHETRINMDTALKTEFAELSNHVKAYKDIAQEQQPEADNSQVPIQSSTENRLQTHLNNLDSMLQLPSMPVEEDGVKVQAQGTAGGEDDKEPRLQIHPLEQLPVGEGPITERLPCAAVGSTSR